RARRAHPHLARGREEGRRAAAGGAGMSTRSIVAVSAGMSSPSSTRLLTDRLTQATEKALSEHGEQVQTRVVELRELAHDVMNAMTTRVPTGELRGVLEDLGTADGLIAVTPVFNASYSGLFKSFFDIVEPEDLDGDRKSTRLNSSHVSI